MYNLPDLVGVREAATATLQQVINKFKMAALFPYASESTQAIVRQLERRGISTKSTASVHRTVRQISVQQYKFVLSFGLIEIGELRTLFRTDGGRLKIDFTVYAFGGYNTTQNHAHRSIDDTISFSSGRFDGKRPRASRWGAYASKKLLQIASDGILSEMVIGVLDE